MSPIFLLSSLSLYCTGEAPDHVPGDVAGYLGVLLEATARVLVPVLPERHVDPQLVPGPDQYPPELLVHAEKHLELVATLGHLELVKEPEGVPDKELVVGSDAHVRATPKEFLEEEPVVLPYGV